MDRVLDGFLRRQAIDARELDAASDIVSVTPVAGTPPFRYVLAFACTGLVRVGERIETARRFVTGVTFPADYLRRRPNPARLLTLLEPAAVWQPNVKYPFVCIGDVEPGTPLVDLCHRLYEVISYQKLTPVEYDALNADACVWARRHMHRFPLDSRPLRRSGATPGAGLSGREAQP